MISTTAMVKAIEVDFLWVVLRFYCESGELVNPLPSRTYELDLHIKSKGRGKVSCAGTSSIEIDFDCTRMVGVRTSALCTLHSAHVFAGGTVGRLSIFPNASFFRKPTDSSRRPPSDPYHHRLDQTWNQTSVRSVRVQPLLQLRRKR